MGVAASARSMIQRAMLERRVRRSLAEARAGLVRLSRRPGGLSSEFKRRAEAYSGDVFGTRQHAPWLHLYSECRGEFREGWLPVSYYFSEVLDRANGGYQHMARHRAANTALFGSDAFPDLAYCVNGRLMWADYTPCDPSELAGQAKDLVFKPDHSGFGRGIRFLSARDLDAARIARLGNGVLQPRLIPHDSFAQIDMPSLATLRIGTVVGHDGEVSVRTAYLKMGRKAESHVISASQVRVPVDWRTGLLAADGYLADWTPVTAHPDTGDSFAGRSLPGLDEFVEIVTSLHRKLPLARYLCWDLVRDASGRIRVLEWEGGVVSFAEATQGPCFADLGWARGQSNG
ncbi:sugar-transfer associated ATP-grasp domain-containing protein [Jannaschia seohaensis]|uniref:Putative polysaccharide biosynthesis protein n=1 Tax=Jannaschia seohaensis TaxID=475081 RepID=A0A2Y9C1C1_9RHOB|nr:sugar-transfer associated ATP-grasp domain-containing protein [Jannaschia seohaensis]PWJ17553.1 putative polysaccharide biosynthesis protein [Jannaschia seohaensis]SSA47702.1 Sugar-transfer associated ATP-grasp [Jannaschia seohaensis]